MCRAAPKQIADSAIAAAKAGAAVVHCHVRDPETGVPSRLVNYYREVTERIRDAEVDVVLNLTSGMGGDLVFGSPFGSSATRQRHRHGQRGRARGPYRGMPARDVHA